MSPKVMAGGSGTIQRPDNFKIFMTKMQKKNNKLVSKFAPPPQTKTTTRDINLRKEMEGLGLQTPLLEYLKVSTDCQSNQNDDCRLRTCQTGPASFFNMRKILF